MIYKYQQGDTIQGNKYRQEGAQAQQYQETEAARRRAAWLSRQEMRPVVVKKATRAEKIKGKKDVVKQVPHVIGMSGVDPLLGFATETYVGGKVLKGVGQLYKALKGKQAVKASQKSSYKTSSGIKITPESEIEQMYPVYKDMKKSKHFKAFDAPYFEEHIGNNNVTLLGQLDAGKYSEYQAERIIQNMKRQGFDPDAASGSLLHDGQRVYGKPSTFIREKSKAPINMYVTDESTSVTGFQLPGNGRAYARVYQKATPEDIRSTTIHEGVSHGTDDVVNTATNGTAAEQYGKITKAVKDAGFAKTKGTEHWYELRSTMAEFMRKMFNKHTRATPGATYADVQEAVYKEIDNMPINKLAKGLQSLNDYGKDYYNYLMQNPFEVSKFKELLKYGMGYGAPVGVATWGMVPQQKKGGKTHKPFGHRSILDNGWQSTKQLKNKKNVYGK